MTRRDRRRLMVSLALAFAVASFLTLALIQGWFTAFQNLTTDRVFQTLTSDDLRRTANNVVIVGIDEKSIRELGRFGDWPRAHYARLVDRLNDGCARVIAFDVGFLESHPDDPMVAASLRRFAESDIDRVRQQCGQAQRRSIVLPVIGLPEDPTLQRAGEYKQFPDRGQDTDTYRSVTPFEGHVNVVPDADGSVRRSPLVIRAQGQEYPALGLMAAMAYTNQATQGFTRDADGHGIRAMRRLLPTDPFFRMIITWAGPPSRVFRPESQTFRSVSFVDVMQGNVPPETFKDKMVFLGLMDASGFADDYQVPTSEVGGKMKGVEIHANVFTTVVAPFFYKDQDLITTIGVVWIVCYVTALVVFRFSVVVSAVFAFIAGASWFLGGQTYATHPAFRDLEGTPIPNLVFPPLGLLMTFLLAAIYRVVIEQAEVRATRSAMSKYLSPAIMAEVLKDPDQLRLGGDQRVMTVLFTDIRGFTSISEQMQPTALIELLNGYLTAMTDIVYEWQGVLDKYMGDAIMAWWGAPTDQPDHAYRACMTGLQMRATLRELHKTWAEQGVPQLEMGVGVNTGPMVYGNTGSKERFDFTVLGDAVNLSSRLEGANKEYGSNVIISESTFQEIKDRHFVTRFLDVIEVKGKTEPVPIYELIGLEGQVESWVPELVSGWDIAMGLYRARDFSLAESAFQRVLDISPTDGPANVYVQRCMELRTNPPAPDWDGVFVMTHK
jgi:adenylate cyclase